jgi:EAL domain-containing protein (putative c-di-GMP-specific phosphodiesterase class I)
LRHGLALAEAMALADEALARAELRGAFAVELMTGPGRPGRPSVGESAWRKGLEAALAEGRAALVSFPVVDAQGNLLHLESPLRIQLEAGGAFEPAAWWLPLAVRTRMTAAADARAVALALEAIARDGLPRSVNLAPSSLADSDFSSRMRTLLFAAPRSARKLSLEIDEAAAVERFALLRELARLVRPCGVRFGLEHAGRHLASIDHLFEDWLDFVKLDQSFTTGAGADAQRAGFVSAAVGLLHGLAIDVHAEGVRDDGDAMALWSCGVDGMTGPWATARHGAVG